MRFNGAKVTILALGASLAACGGSKSDDSKTDTAAVVTTTTVPAGGGGGGGTDATSFVLSGSLALGTYGLTAANPVTHVIAYNPENGASAKVAVAADGSFSLPLNPRANADAEMFKSCIDEAAKTADGACMAAIDPSVADQVASMTPAEIYEAIMSDKGEEEGSYDPTDPTPWTLMYANANATGKDMIISRFGSGTLDTIAPRGDSTGSLQLGTVTPVAGARATTTTEYADVLKGIDMSTETAATLGEIDTVSLRYTNPDIDNNGQFDADEKKSFILDFHNRFGFKSTADGAVAMQFSDMKNKYPEDVVGGLANLTVQYQGTGIVPEMEKDNFSAAPSSYRWKFDFANASDPAVALGSSATCTGSGETTNGPVANGAWCTRPFTVNPNYDRYQMGLEVATPPEGTYTLEAGGKTFTWTNVEVADFSAGEGFIAIMSKWEVDEKGTPGNAADDVVTGYSYKYMKRSGGAWAPATEDELKTVLKPGAGLSFKGANNKSCFFRLDRKPTGSMVFKDLDIDEVCEELTANERTALKNETFLWSTVTNPGISYDDKLGMRYFF